MALYTLLLITLRLASALAQTSTSIESPTSTAAPDTSGDVNAEYKLWGYDGCSSSQINDIKSGFSEMVIMVMGEGTIITKYPKIDWNSAVAQDFWGPAERNRVYRDLIQKNLDRLASVSYDFWIDSSASWLQKDSVVTAYTIDHKPHINFCPGYFTRKTLATAMMGGDWVSARSYYNRASVWAHEFMHVKDIGHVMDMSSGKGIDDQPVRNWAQREGQKAYGELNTKWIAQDPSGNYREVVESADSYAYSVTLNYMQKTLGYYLSDPQIQISPQGRMDLVTNNVTVESQAENDGDDQCYWV